MAQNQEAPVVGNFQGVADAGKSKVPMTLAFDPNNPTLVIDSTQTRQALGTHNVHLANITAVEVSGGHNGSSMPVAVSIKQGDDSKLPTMSRDFLVAPRNDPTAPASSSAVVATHAVLHCGVNSHSVTHYMQSNLQKGFVSPLHVNGEDHVKGVKKGWVWHENVGQTAKEVLQGATIATSENGSIKRYAFPLHGNGAMSRLIKANWDSKDKFRQMFPTSNHEKTTDICDADGKPTPHVVLSENDARNGSDALARNLQADGLTKGLKVTVHHTDGTPIDGHVMVRMQVHRKPIGEDMTIENGHYVTHDQANKIIGSDGAPAVGSAAPVDGAAAAIFAIDLPDGANKKGEGVGQATAEPAAMVEELGN